ncbi:unannotated protein [freshwater metagenome]|uniref:Unannotated protein n=1 Tax=freshwater metagenome TaxID=449393 RepID=A0A6J7C2V1_9ZZZZ|nr:hypothetical protein [Actinomycetota bacterium]MSW24950.1 hypothetical protein [Actinomycetota bacterium]MSX29168.1 hypothetical protein [Actinomycetota bacterium]MSX44144.1 hypothetical protein [Actinomycetota bacterium]MSX96553.1 hypothetical protein [Actinomycetota bacterium]
MNLICSVQKPIDMSVATDAACGLWPLARTWRTFPGARLSNGQGLEAAARFDVA